MTDTKAYILSLGCPKNLVDAEVMAADLAACGYEATDAPEEAQLIVLNTCAFILPAKEESIDEILRLAQYKKPPAGVCRYLVVTGCLPQRYGQALEKSLPEVDLFLGTGEVAGIGYHVDSLQKMHNKSVRTVQGEPLFLMTSEQSRILATPSHSAYLKIADGCSNCCSYCVIPSIRGKARSRNIEDITREAATLAQRGVKEIILIAQDTTAYGQDLPGKPTLAQLLSQLVSLDNLQWIRLLYTYPGSLDRRLLQLIGREEKICKYLDIPIQHIDDAILKSMNRRSDRRRITQAIEEIRAHIPGVALRTSLIVGFPGETKTRFEGLLTFIREARFDHLGVFKYSKEGDTPAATFPSQIPERVKEERRQILMEEQAGISFRINQCLVGSRQVVLVEEKSDLDGYSHTGRCARQAPEVDGLTYIGGDHLAAGDMVECLIVEADEYDLFAEPIVTTQVDRLKAFRDKSCVITQVRARCILPQTRSEDHSLCVKPR